MASEYWIQIRTAHAGAIYTRETKVVAACTQEALEALFSSAFYQSVLGKVVGLKVTCITGSPTVIA